MSTAVSSDQKVTIDRLSSRGKGMARFNNLSVEIAGALPGEEVLVELGRRKQHGCVKGFLRDVITPSPDRVEPRCSHVPQCGGCLWQQMDYAAQLRIKEEAVRKLFEPFPEARFHPILGCSDPWRYRNKMEFSFSQNAAGNRYLGLVLVGGNGRVLDLQECHLTSEWSIDLLKAVRGWWEESGLAAYRHSQDTGHLRTLTVREAKQGRGKLVMLTVSGNPGFAMPSDQIKRFVDVVRATGEDISIFVRVHQILKKTPTQFYEMHLSGPDHIVETLHVLGRTLHFKISPTSFFQPNTLQAQELYSRALGMLKLTPETQVFDLYCGTATMGISVAHMVKEVVGIELNPHAIFDATCNMEMNAVSNVALHRGDVGEVLASLGASRPEVAIVDPPRSGLDEKAVKNLIALRPQQLLYVSCFPKTQAENIALLREAGYVLQDVQPVDQFPHTVHVENIALLTCTAP